MASSWVGRSRPTARSPQGGRFRCALVKHGVACVVALFFVVCHPRASVAAIDLTGDWYASVEFGSVFVLHIVQTGTALQAIVGAVSGSGTINTTTGGFTLTFPFVDPNNCGEQLNAQADMSSTTFIGTATVVFTDPNCMGGIFTCACMASQTAELRGSKAPCGNGSVDPGEQCDDANFGRNGDCCALGCTPQPAGQVCASDGNPCTSDVCDALGTCTHPNEPNGTDCSDGLFCNGQESCQDGACQGTPPCPLLCDEATAACVTGCPSAPLTCRTAAKSLLRAVSTGGPRDMLRWRWSKGAPTSQAEFADPTASSDYALCVFAGAAPALIDQAVVPADATKWTALGTTGYRYVDSAATAPAIDKVVLKGSAQDRSRVLLKNKGASLSGFPPSVSAPLTVQLVNGTTGLCWGATYTGQQLLKNADGQIKAKAP